MEHKVTLLPSGHTFLAHANESILEAGLRAGYNLRYQCDNGSCGECRSRLLLGRIAPVHHSDFLISEAEKGQGGFLLCASQALSDLTIEAAEYDDASDMPYQEVRARVRRIELLSSGILVLQLRTPRTKTFRFLAGQCAALEIPDGTAQLVPVASCPCNGMMLEFHFRHKPNDRFSDAIFSRLAINDEVVVKGPHGDFILDEESRKPILFIAHDIGFAGIKSLAEHAISLEVPQRVYLLRITCNSSDEYMSNLCRSWADAIDNFFYMQYKECESLSCGENNSEQSCDEFLAEVNKITGQPISGCEVYMSGETAMIDGLAKVLMQAGLPVSQLHVQEIL